MSGDCGCGPGWRAPKVNGTCGACGGWLPGERPRPSWLETLINAPDVEEPKSSPVNPKGPFGV